MNMPTVSSVHVPTLGTALIAIILVLVVYHFCFAKR